MHGFAGALVTYGNIKSPCQSYQNTHMILKMDEKLFGREF